MLADRSFRYELSDDWIPSGSGPEDFGWDYWVSLRNPETRRVGADFFVQLKGTGAPGLVGEGEFLSQELEVSAVNYLLMRSCPSLLAVCDLDDPSRPVYWVWLHEALRAVSRDWKNQKSVTVRVPRSNRLRESQGRIQADALRWHEEAKIDQALAEAAAVAVPAVRDDKPGSVVGPNEAKQTALAAFAKADLVDLGPDGMDAKPVSAAERSIRLKLREAKTLIDSYAYQQASDKLAEVERELDAAVDVAAATRAAFLNRRAVLALRDLHYGTAVELFGQALAQAPDDVRYQLNLITAEGLAADDAPDRRAEWLQRVDDALARDPASEQAIGIKARLLAHDDLPGAEAFLRRSKFWIDKPDDARLLLAELLSATDPVRALEELAVLTPAGAGSSHALSQRGFVLFAQAMGSPTSDTVPVRGFGPGNLDLRLIQQSADAYEQACAALAKLNYPRFGQDVFRNTAQILVIAGRARTAVKLCDGFLRAHPDSLVVLEAVSVALNVIGEHDTAADHLGRCVDSDPSNETAFKNLMMALYAADRFEELESRAQKRLGALASPDETATCYEFLALSAAELGRHDEAASHLRAIEALDKVIAAPIAAAIGLLSGKSPAEVRAELRRVSDEHPNDPVLAGHFVGTLLPISSETASEITRVFEERIAPHRQLSPREVQWFGRAQVEQGRLEDAEGTFRRGLARYPDDPQLAFDLAVTLSDLGRVDEAYDVMAEAARNSTPTAGIQQNLALLAASTGRLERAIELFEQALRRASTPPARRGLSGQLFELRKRRGDGRKELLRAAIQYGHRDSAEELPADLEARFLMMCLIAGSAQQSPDDGELRRWTEEFQSRLEVFCDRYPKHRALRRIRIPDGTDGETLVSYLSDLLAGSYPDLMHGVQVELSARGVPYPLCFRARMLPGPGSTTLSYWEHCITSVERSNRIRCVIDPASLGQEMDAVALGTRVVIDIVALLTLDGLGLLDEALSCFEGWVIAAETRELIDSEALGLPSVDPRARALSDWLVRNRAKVTVRHVARSARRKRPGGGPYESNPAGLLVRREVTYSELLQDGIGASMELAAQLKLPLFSDEGVTRHWAEARFGVKGFSTVAFLGRLRQRGNLSDVSEARLLGMLLGWNYREVPIGARHMHAALRAMVDAGETPDSSTMNADPVLGPLIRYIGDPEMEGEGVIRACSELLAMCIADDHVPGESTDAIAFTLSFKNQLRVPGGVLKGSTSESPALALASLWAGVLINLMGRDEHIGRGWTLMRSTLDQLHRSAPALAQQIAEGTAALTVRGVKQATAVGMDVRNQVLLRLAMAIPETDQGLWFKAM
jgi:tetratricopeptide (TPR) repeat protein